MKIKAGRYFFLHNKTTGTMEKVLITEVDLSTRQVEYQTPDGMTQAISIARFIVMAIPYLEAIIDFAVRMYRKFVKSIKT